MMLSDGNLEMVRVVVLSPGDVAEERETVALVVEELNRQVARSHGCQLSLWRWETDARSGMHIAGPQGLIDERMEIGDCDVAIAIFWNRFGTPTGDAQSGTEHELRRAWDAWRENGRPDVIVYFCQRPWFPADAAESDQLHRVMTFRGELPIVLDNIDSPAQLADCLPRGGAGRVLVTSRRRTSGASPGAPAARAVARRGLLRDRHKL